MNAVIQLHSRRPDYRMARLAANVRGIINDPDSHPPETVLEVGKIYLTDVRKWEDDRAKKAMERARERMAAWPPAVKRHRAKMAAEAVGAIACGAIGGGLLAYLLIGGL